MRDEFKESVLARNIWIDFLRGVCLLSVLLTHGLINTPLVGGVLARSFSDAFIDKGYFGVATFFVISGFLIMRNTLRRYTHPERVDFGQFYAMRVARILPSLLIFLIIMIGLAYSGLAMFRPPTKNLLWGSVYAAFTFQYNTYYFVANAPGLHHWAPLWSLSIEELFYAVFPVVCFLSKRRSALVVLLLGIVVVGPCYRREFADVFSFWGAADLLSIGCLAAFATDRFQSEVSVFGRSLLFTGGAIIAVIFILCQVREGFALMPTMLGFGTGVFLIGATALPPVLRPNRVLSVFAALGRVSYEAYLFHVVLIMMLKPVTLAVLAFVGLSAVVTQWASAVIILMIIYWVSASLSRFITEPLNKKIRQSYAGLIVRQN